MTHPRTVIAAALAALGGCGPTGPGGEAGVCRAGGAEVELGTGTNSSFANYRPLSDGDPVYVTPGPQGGQHLWIQLRARGIDPSRPRVSVRALRASDGWALGELRLRVDLTAAPEDPSRVGLPSYALVLDDATFCSVLLPPGDVRLVLDVEDAAARCVRREVIVRVADLDPLTTPATREAWLRCCTAREPRCAPRGDAG